MKRRCKNIKEYEKFIRSCESMDMHGEIDRILNLGQQPYFPCMVRVINNCTGHLVVDWWYEI